MMVLLRDSDIASNSRAYPKEFISEVRFEVWQIQGEVQGAVGVQGQHVFQHLPVLCG